VTSTIKSIYQAAINSYGKQFNGEQCAAWERALSEFSPTIVSDALSAWQKTTTLDFNNRAMGSMMPMAADLRGICERLQVQKAAQSRGEFAPCGKCAEGWHDIRDTKGNRRVVRCACWTTWRSTLPVKDTQRPAPRPRRAGLEQASFPQQMQANA
jgi:hypothetical protein